MKFNLIIKRSAIFYFFIQNLSEWHSTSRKDYNVLWRKELGRFSKKEGRALELFKEVHLRYSFGRLFLGRQFFIERNPWLILKRKLEDKDYEKIKEIFDLFKYKFDKFYKKEGNLLEIRKSELNKKLRNKNLAKKINKTLARLYKTEILAKDINVYLLPSTKDHFGGTGGIVDDKSVNLEISRYPLVNITEAIGVIWHEIIHLYFEKDNFKNLVDSKLGGNREVWNLIKEATASSLLPNGILGKRFLDAQSETLNSKIPKEYNRELLALIRNYASNGEYLDENYVSKLYKIAADLKDILN